MNKFLTLCLATVGVAAPFVTSATAHEAPVSAPVAIAAASLPPVVRINETVVVRTSHHHRRYRVVRRRYLRHGHYVVVTRRVYY